MGFDDKYVKYFFTSGWDNDMMIAFLSRLPFDSFEDNKDGIIGYLHSDEIDGKIINEIENICKQYKLEYQKEEIENRNWNKEWETSFEPVTVGSFCLIKADFHENVVVGDYKYVIDITPEMTFGTGHHETTYMMIELMSELYIENKDVFDFGSGTGILSVLAEKMGAKRILAIDNDPIAVENIGKNAEANKCEKINAQLGDKADIERYSFDIVLANINRHILETEVLNLSLSLRKGGFLLLSGILEDDRAYITELYERNSMKLMKSLSKDKWTALKFVAY